jgi:hypothetical protein
VHGVHPSQQPKPLADNVEFPKVVLVQLKLRRSVIKNPDHPHIGYVIKLKTISNVAPYESSKCVYGYYPENDIVTGSARRRRQDEFPEYATFCRKWKALLGKSK